MAAEAPFFCDPLPRPEHESFEGLMQLLQWQFSDKPDELLLLQQDIAELTEVNLHTAKGPKTERKNGDDAKAHEVWMMIQSANIGLPFSVIRTEAWHDVPEDTYFDLDYVREKTNGEIAGLVDAVTKAKSRSVKREVATSSGRSEIEELTLEKLFNAMVTDHRAIYVKAADNANNAATYGVFDREKQVAKAHLSLQVYAPLARQFGLTSFAHMIEDASIRITQPAQVARIEELQNEWVDDGMISAINQIFDTWDGISFEENPLTYITRDIKLPTPYEIFRRAPRPGMYEMQDVVPEVVLNVPSNAFRRRWYAFLESQYGMLAIENGYNAFPDLRQDIAVTKYIPLQVNGQEHMIKVHLVTPEILVTPADVDIATSLGITLSEKEIHAGRAKLEVIIARYQKAVQENMGTGSISLNVTEGADRGLIHFFTASGEKISIPRGSTFADAAYYIGDKLGRDADSATVTRGSVTTDINLEDILQSGDKISFNPSQKTFSLPTRYDIVSTNKAIADITSSVTRNQRKAEVIEDARGRGKRIIDWMYREIFGRNYEMHFEYGFDPKYCKDKTLLKQYLELNRRYDSLDALFIELGFTPLPSQHNGRMELWNTNKETYRVITDTYNFMYHLEAYWQKCPTLIIHLDDSPNFTSQFTNITGKHDLNMLPLHGVADHYGNADKPTLFIVTFSEGNFDAAEDVAAESMEEIVGITGIDLHWGPYSLNQAMNISAPHERRE